MPNIKTNKAIIYNKFQLQPETLQWLAVLTTPPSPTVISCVNQFIAQCKVDGNWQLLDRCWLFAQDNQTNARVSLVNPTSTAITEVNTPTWTALQGYTTNGTTQYLDTNFNSSSSAVNYLQNSGALGIYSRTSGQTAGIDIGNQVVGSLTYIISRFTDDNQYHRVNVAASFANAANTNGQGLFASVRTDVNNIFGFKNGLQACTASIASTAPINLNIYIGATNSIGVAATFSARQYSMAFVGGGAMDSLKFYNAFQTLAGQLKFSV